MSDHIPTETVMGRVHDCLVREFGRLTPELIDEGRTQLVYLPGGRYATTVVLSSENTGYVRKALGPADLSEPGVAEFLLREHSKFLFGRFELNDDFIVVEHTIMVDCLTEALPLTVRAVHSIACDAVQLLTQVEVLGTDEQSS